MEQARNGILREDNASTHISKLSAKWKVENGIRTRLWPANSPDLNPIENRRLEEEHIEWLTANLDEFAGHSVLWLTT